MARKIRLVRNLRAPGDLTVKRSVDEQIHEVFAQLYQEAQEIDDPAYRDLWMDAIDTFIDTGDVASLVDVCKWRRPVVDPEEFLFGQGYLHQRDVDVYPGVLKAFMDLDSDHYGVVVEKGALGIGKTTLANLRMARDLYKVSCMRDPQMTYGLAKRTPIVFTIQSIRLTTAKKVVFEELGRYIKESPYFQQKFKYNPYVTSEMQFPEHNVRILPVSSSGNAVISMNVLGGQLDEANFMQKTKHSKSQHADDKGNFDQAKQLFDTLHDRQKSRFLELGGLPGALYLISSSRFPDDYTEIKARESTMYGGPDDSMYIYEGSQWSIKGRDKFKKEEFAVQIGNDTYPSKVLEKDEQPHPGCTVIMVPENFRKQFVQHTDDALRNFAGVTTLSTKPFLSQRQLITQAQDEADKAGYQNIVAREEYVFDGREITLPRPMIEALRLDIDTPRAVHVDLGVSKDACGLAIGHIAGHKIDETKNDLTGQMDKEIKPVIAYDCIMRIVAPVGGEVDFESIRKFIIRLRDHYKLPIKWVTFDGFQSIDSRQLLRKKGFQSDYLSVEKVEPWRTFRDAIYDGRVLLTRHAWVAKELAEVESITQNNKEKVDHTPNGTKDVADAVVGVAATLFSRKLAWSQVQYSGGQTGLFLMGDPKRRTGDPKRYVNDIQSDEAYQKSNRPESRRKLTLRKSIRRK